MARVMEIVQIRVRPESTEALLSTREGAIAAIRELPGFVSAHLAQLDGERWVDVVLWRTREDALAAAEHAPRMPEIARHFQHITEVVAMEHAEIRSEARV